MSEKPIYKLTYTFNINPKLTYIFDINPKLLLIPIFEVSCSIDDFIYKAYFNLSGDIHKEKAEKPTCLLLLLMKACMVESTEQYGLIKLAEELIKNDFITTVESFKLLPTIINTSEMVKNQDDEDKIETDYVILGTWIERWHYKQSTRDLKEQPYYKLLEKEAKASEKLYYLIYELHNRKRLSVHYNIYWLLIELGKYLNKLNSTAFTLDGVYCNKKKYLQSLTDFNSEPETEIVSIKDLKQLLSVLKKAVDKQAREVAKSDRDFSQQFYDPYIKAEKSANSARKKNFKFVPGKKAERKMPGGKLGHKKRKGRVTPNGITYS